MEWLVDFIDYGAIGILFVFCFIAVGFSAERFFYYWEHLLLNTFRAVAA
jgi:hypothetical protein